MKNKKITEEKNDNRTLGEKLEDGMDEVMTGLQDAIYGEPKSPNEDIPRMIERPSGIRKINKVQTRRNINRKIFKKPVLKGIGIFLLIVLVIFIIYEIIFVLLMK